MLRLGRSGLLEGAFAADGNNYYPYTFDVTKALLFFSIASPYTDTASHLQQLGNPQWGIVHETGNYPGAWWLDVYQIWYEVPAIADADNADLIVVVTMTVLFVILLTLPFIPGLRRIPHGVKVYRLIWREPASKYAAEARRQGEPDLSHRVHAGMPNARAAGRREDATEPRPPKWSRRPTENFANSPASSTSLPRWRSLSSILSGQSRLGQQPPDQPRALGNRGTGVRAPVGDLEGGHGHADTHCDASQGGPLPVRRQGLPCAREVQRHERRVGLQRQIGRSTLNLGAVDPSLGKDGHRPALSENRKRLLEATDVSLIFLYRK